MKRAAQLLACLLLLTPWLLADSPGSIFGVVVPTPRGEQSGKQWVWIRGSNGMVRRIAVDHAGVSYDPKCPTYVRKRSGHKSLLAGTEVRVTAQLGADGEWRATKLEILGWHKLPIGDDLDDEDEQDSGAAMQQSSTPRTI